MATSGIPVLYKPFGSPTSGNAGRATIATSTTTKGVDIVDSNGNVLSSGRKDTIPHTPEPGAIPGPYNQNWWVGSASEIPAGSAIRVTNGDGSVSYVSLQNPYQGYKGFINSGEGTQFSNAAVLPVNQHGGIGGGSVGGSVIPGTNVINPQLADPNMIQFNPVGYNPATYDPINAAPFQFTDPIAAAQKIGAYNIGAADQAFQIGTKRGQELFNMDASAVANYEQNASDIQKRIVASENAFNQAQRLQAVDFALPGARASLEAKHQRGETYASGKLLTSAEDRAYQLAAESSSAGGNLVRGFGDDSLVGKRTSEILTAQQRLGISQMGENLLDSWIQQGANLLVDTPLKANISQQIQANPRILPSQLVAQQQENIQNLTTLPVQFGIQSEIGQQEFGTNLEQQTRTFNAGNKLGLSEFNSSNTLAKDEYNSTGQYNESVTKFNALTGNYQLVNQANQAAQNQILSESQNQAASAAADQNISAQQSAQNAQATGSIAGGVIGAIKPISDAVSGVISTGGQIIDSILGTAPSVPTPTPGINESPLATSAPDIATPGPSIQPGPTIQAAQDQGLSSGSYISGGGGSGGGGGYGGSSGGVDIGGNAPSAPMSERIFTGPADPGLNYQQVASGYHQIGGFVSSMGQMSTPTPAMASFGSAIQNGSQTAQGIVANNPSVSSNDQKVQLLDKMQQTAVQNAASPENAQNVRDTFTQVKDSVLSGTKATGEAAGLLNFVNTFDQLSPAQKIRGIVNSTLSGIDLAHNLGITDTSAQSVAKLPVPGTNNLLTVGSAVSLLNAGYNVYAMVDHWDQLTGIQKALGGSNTLLSLANTGKSLNLLGTATPVSQAALGQNLTRIGAQTASSEGIGAISVPVSNAGELSNLGYTVTNTAQNGAQVIAVPNSTLASTGQSTGVLGSGMAPATEFTAANGLAVAGGVLGIGMGAYQLAQGWGQGGARGRLNGALSGTSIAAGLYSLGAGSGISSLAFASNPYLLGAVLLGGMALGSFKAGKSTAQGTRDAFRAQGQKVGLIDQNFNVNLANGSKYDVGVDGHGNQRDWYNPDFIRPDQANLKGSKLNAWDVDYTRDLDAVTQLSGNALSLMVYGDGHTPYTQQMGNYFTNAAVSNSGSADLTSSGFTTAMANMKKMYSDAGVASKSDGYKLINQMLAEGRIDQNQAISAQQGINLVYDDKQSFGAAQHLLEGVKLGRQGKSSPEPTPIAPTQQPAATGVKFIPKMNRQEKFNLPVMQ